MRTYWKAFPDLTEDDINQICDSMRLIGGQTQFETLHKAYNYFVDGMQYTPSDGIARTVNFINFDDTSKNIFKVVNQFTVEYVNNNEKKTRRPRKITENEVPNEEKKEKDEKKEEIKKMDIYTEEELREIEAEENENAEDNYEEDEDVDYDEFDEYYDEEK